MRSTSQAGAAYVSHSSTVRRTTSGGRSIGRPTPLIRPTRTSMRSLFHRLRSTRQWAIVPSAREKSVDATSLDGGLLGKVDPSTLREEIRTALHGLGPGQLSPVFRLSSGFAIVKVLAPDEFAGIVESQRSRQAAIRAEGSIRF